MHAELLRRPSIRAGNDVGEWTSDQVRVHLTEHVVEGQAILAQVVADARTLQQEALRGVLFVSSDGKRVRVDAAGLHAVEKTSKLLIAAVVAHERLRAA